MAEYLTFTLSSWFMLLLFQLIGWPVVALLTKKTWIDRGWAISRPLTWHVLGLLIWFPANFHLPVNTTMFIWILVSAGLVISLFLVYRHLFTLIELVKSSWPYFLFEECLFALGLFGLSLIRCFNPAILDLEKFMDAGFMASYVRSPTLPAPDIWLAGSSINYYSFGHFLGSVMSRLWLIPIRYSYNLLLGLIMGLVFMLSFSIVINLLAPLLQEKMSRRPLFIGGLIGSLFVTVGGNTHTIWYFLKHGNWQGYWYADATRFIEHTIHEFPSYSFVVSDLHAHVWGLPFVLTFLVILPVWVKYILSSTAAPRYYRSYAAVMGIFLGTFMMASTWDLMLYGLLTGIVGLIILSLKPQTLVSLVTSAIIAALCAGITAAPWAIHFKSISEGVRLATEHTPIWQLFVLWTGHVTLSLVALGIALYLLKKHVSHSLIIVIALVATAWLLLFLPEVIYFKDIYTGHPRANTMFKFTYQAFVMMSLLGGWAIGMALMKGYLAKLFRYAVGLIVLIVFSCVMLFPYFAYRDYYGALRTFKGLDGWAWLQDQYPNDYQAILWLENNVKGQPHILESWGESYTTFDRISAFTGLPTVIGWRVHEWLWRGGFEIAGQRSGEVDNIYRKPLSKESLAYLNQYQVEYIVIGDKEREAYPNDMSLQEILTLGPTVFQAGQTRIIKFTPQPISHP